MVSLDFHEVVFCFHDSEGDMAADKDRQVIGLIICRFGLANVHISLFNSVMLVVIA